jgi:NADPH:quinone reductase-like Zn-dependent oxidoreductase
MCGMKAARIHRIGGPSVFKFEEVPLPKPRRGEFLIEVHCAGVNPVDIKIRQGKFKLFKPDLPATLGRDIAGVVRAVGGSPTKGRRSPFRIGDEVFGMLDYDRGAYAEYTVACAREIARRPKKVTEKDAATLGVAALTAWQGLFDHGHLKRGQRVLIHGAAGGVGHFAVQFAKIAGATVIATASERDLGWVRKLGADEVFDFKNQRFEEHTGDIDLVLDLIAGETQERSWGVLKASGGAIVSTLSEPSKTEARRHEARGVRMVVKAKSEQLRKIASLVASGRVKVTIGKVFPLREVGNAHDSLENDHVRGKVILEATPRWLDLDARSNESAERPSEENAIYARANIPGVTLIA